MQGSLGKGINNSLYTHSHRLLTIYIFKFMKFAFLGDVHGHFQDMLKTIKDLPKDYCIYQVGDFGFGFPPLHDDIDLGISSSVYNPLKAKILPSNLKVIRGNHDCPSSVIGHPNYLGDYGVDSNGIGYISGAMSVDKDLRTPGLDWWPEEELSLFELDKLVDLISNKKPRVVISHTAPYAFEYYLEKFPKVSRTNQALDELWKCHAPELWVCGHHHVNETKRLKETLFCCVNKNQTLLVDLPEDRPLAISDIIFE